MPYIYTLAAQTYHNNGTILRALAMDFPEDQRARDIADQYLFGPAFLVAPVHEYQARSRQVWLPEGAGWHDFNTGQRHAGGQSIEADAPLAQMPLFVRDGSIVPTGPAIRHTGEGLDGPLTINVYTGADGEFVLYEDEGTSYGYQRGEFARIPLSWDDTAGVLTVGERDGRYPGMAETRTVHVRFVDGNGPAGREVDAEPDATLQYTGERVTIRR